VIVRLKREYPHWGAPKIRERLRRRYPDVPCPAISTVHALLDRHGLVTHRTRRRYRAEGTPLSQAIQPNDLWCADYKGEFMLADRRYCYPLTITDFATRYLMTCDALATTQPSMRLPSSSGPSGTLACHAPSGPITGCRSPAATRSTA
jgi:putative transposase